ncbi:MAG TPA: hypothetical protein VK541_04225 [Pedobacter sp.]|uniref:hypothetical protein n=1 Tax=Pedobacter sp. TaxID=1411316 RepID=UPI002BE317FE|nr:hypothetical protein [Pedobacter sp.]HMI01662.1 hypothetical protein [Pedobacter sp.]
MAQHFDPYFDLQVLGLKTVLSNALNKNTEKLLQDYLTFIPDLVDFLIVSIFPFLFYQSDRLVHKHFTRLFNISKSTTKK